MNLKIVFVCTMFLVSSCLIGSRSDANSNFDSRLSLPLLGLERPEIYLPLLAGKRVGLVVNQASVTRDGTHAIDFLLSHHVHLVKLFGLEHGIRGEGGAGEILPDTVDSKTGLPVVSLYGAHKKPTTAMLADLDVVVYDIQDVGVRFFTYISSLGLIMEAAQANAKEVVVFDRPNPNGDYIGGPILKKNNQSFVGKYPIPIVYGLTAGELAKMIVGKGWLATSGVKLNVVPMSNYDRRRIYSPPVWPSPGLRNIKAIRMYPSIALLEPTVLNYGGGTDYPYLQYGYPDARMGNESYIPYGGPMKNPPRFAGLRCYGRQFYQLPVDEIPHFSTDLLVEALRKFHGPQFFSSRQFLDLLVGDSDIVAHMLAGESQAQIEPLYRAELAAFDVSRRAFMLY